ncbi:MAG: D-2-hydroxyacid dehydrogenase family protein [SAR202 cluster bacterium]|nr:D-2-hydroxyacid dehydrogenase family protein [SAR202 cluster bacterium]MDP6513757.1 D-2-hydroxyacid dehydrogenase family protein [SAR202 cluster bacterium]
MTKIAVLDDYQSVALETADWSRLRPDAQVDVFQDHLADEADLAERLNDYEIVVGMRERTPFQRSLLERLPNLRLLITTGMGNASFDMNAAADLGITVCGTGGLPYPTAELTWALILALFRKVPDEDRATREGSWQVSLGEGLQGKTLGMMGLGRLGSQVATVGNAFGMNVIAWSQNLAQERASEFNAKLVTKQELLSQSDVMSIHLVLSARSRGLIGAEDLALMKPSSYLVNTSRGPIVDEAALVDALRNNTIAGAGLDVFDIEPLPLDHPLRNLPNTVLTPHVGYVTVETYRIFYGDAVENITSFMDGAAVRVINNPSNPR